MPACVFTIPPSAPFLPTLITALTGGRLGFRFAADPLALAAATLYLPTRRACRLARDAFLDALDRDAAILPRIVAIGDIDEDEIAFAEAASGTIAADALALPPALGGLERRLLLARLIMTWAAAPEVRGASGGPLVAQTPAAACALADDLARLIDDVTMRGVSWNGLDGLVPEALDPYWQLTLKFLQIARQAWPDVLRERGFIEPAARRDALIKAETARLARKTDAPVIVAGSTGSIPATADLIAAIARLPHGAVVLPGLDTDLDEASWRLIGGDERNGVPPAPGHPQFALQALLRAHRRRPRRGRATCRTSRARAARLGSAAPGGGDRPLAAARRRSVVRGGGRCGARHHGDDRSGARRGRGARHRGRFARSRGTKKDRRARHAGSRARAPGRRRARALVDRRGGFSRASARRHAGGRVCAACRRGGARRGCAGDFARLAQASAAAAFLARHRASVAALERAVLRGPRPRRGSAGLAGAVDALRTQLEKFRRKEEVDLHASDPRIDLADGELAAAGELVRRLAAALAPLEGIGREHDR